MGYLFLAIAIVAEVIATSFLRLTSGDGAKWWAYGIVGVGYAVAFTCLSLSLSRGIPLGIAYAIWAAVGVALVALVSWLAFGETLTWIQVGGILLIIVGVTLVELGGRHP
ncbi:DMT family transporter [Amnibacterium flavum]|uniref:QacE family quaternary ammonium compound efflux SMR transporter n=1 Tax=Amnibacterium flavum TaxID=2173173 RepID=A0A2V1HQM1_9MICO|nr:multidrug efflux SMR transporter [Amnibacterium flavum]PVZ93932.1 QacE family quaternary ammonium compound efflux SMR transporter [Amnibacterium flavum]